MLLRNLFAALLFFVIPALPVLALENPQGEVILTVSGAVTSTNQADAAVFDRAMLEKLPQQKYTVVVPWFTGPQTFEGPLLADVLAQAKATGKQLTFKALNDYKVTYSLAEAKKNKVILALRHNGEVMTPRTKGPLFVMFPFDRNEALRSSEYYQRCVWQLHQIAVQ